MQDIINAVCDVLSAKYNNPKIPIEITNQPEGFARPSFFVEFITEVQTDMNHLTYESDIPIQITYFAPRDEYYNTDTDDQFAKYEEVKKLFTDLISLPVGSRYCYINSITGAPRNQEVYLTLNLTDRASRAEVLPEPATTIQINIQEA